MWELYSDGGSRPNPGQAAYSAVLYKDSELIESIGGFMGESTNNKAEYKAFFSGLKLIEDNCNSDDEIVCYLDSQLVLKQITKEWKVKDESLKYITIKCQDLTSKFNNIKLKWVKGHSGNKGNEYVDSVCTYFIEKQKDKIEFISETECIKLEKKHNSKIYINCPYSDKDEAKSLGAKWDIKEKKWYITSELQDLFEKWL
jgi:ribonuclease HI